MEDKTYNLNTERISGMIDINENQTYDNLIMDGEGCLRIGGRPDLGVSQIDIKIKNLVIKKSPDEKSYEFKFTAPLDRELLITVEIEDLKNDISVLSYGYDGFKGKNGSDGKDGKDGKSGKNEGDGKDGSDGMDGSDGEDGGACSNVIIQYNTTNESSITFKRKLAKGGEGGKGGKGGLGGKGYKGGKDDKEGKADKAVKQDKAVKLDKAIKPDKAGRDGRDGRDGRNGRDGRDGKEGYILIRKGNLDA